MIQSSQQWRQIIAVNPASTVVGFESGEPKAVFHDVGHIMVAYAGHIMVAYALHCVTFAPQEGAVWNFGEQLEYIILFQNSVACYARGAGDMIQK